MFADQLFLIANLWCESSKDFVLFSSEFSKIKPKSRKWHLNCGLDPGIQKGKTRFTACLLLGQSRRKFYKIGKNTLSSEKRKRFLLCLQKASWYLWENDPYIVTFLSKWRFLYLRYDSPLLNPKKLDQKDHTHSELCQNAIFSHIMYNWKK